MHAYCKTALFCCIDDLVKVYITWSKQRLIPHTKLRNREGYLSLSEQLFIIIVYHLSSYKDLSITISMV